MTTMMTNRYIKDHQHLMLLHEASDFGKRFPDLPDFEVLETVFTIVQHPHAISEHLPENCALCRSIIKAYDHGYEVGLAMYEVFYRNND